MQVTAVWCENIREHKSGYVCKCECALKHAGDWVTPILQVRNSLPQHLFHYENLKDVPCKHWPSHYFSLQEEFPYSVISDGADFVASLGGGGGMEFSVFI